VPGGSSPKVETAPVPTTSVPDLRLLPGEELLETAPNVTHICQYDGVVHGVLYLTNFKLVFQSQTSGIKNKVFHSVCLPRAQT